MRVDCLKLSGARTFDSGVAGDSRIVGTLGRIKLSESLQKRAFLIGVPNTGLETMEGLRRAAGVGGALIPGINVTPPGDGPPPPQDPPPSFLHFSEAI